LRYPHFFHNTPKGLLSIFAENVWKGFFSIQESFFQK